jgi:LacI family transcriptional regulator
MTKQKVSITDIAKKIGLSITTVSRVLNGKVKPTAIFAFSNTIAMGCMKALKEENIKISHYISLITFDEHPYLEYLSTPLSCGA